MQHDRGANEERNDSLDRGGKGLFEKILHYQKFPLPDLIDWKFSLEYECNALNGHNHQWGSHYISHQGLFIEFNTFFLGLLVVFFCSNTHVPDRLCSLGKCSWLDTLPSEEKGPFSFIGVHLIDFNVLGQVSSSFWSNEGLQVGMGRMYLCAVPRDITHFVTIDNLRVYQVNNCRECPIV